MSSNISMETETFFKSFNPHNAINYFGQFEVLSENKIDPILFNDDRNHIKDIENALFFYISDDNHGHNYAKKPINVGSFLNILREYVKLNKKLTTPSMIFYSMHSIYDNLTKSFFYMITTDFGVIIIERENETRFFVDNVTEISNSDKALSLERMEDNMGKYRCIQYGCYDFNTKTHFVVKPYTSQFHIFNKDFDNTYDFYFTRKYNKMGLSAITRSFADLYQSATTTLFCDKMGHVNMTTAPIAQTMSLDGFSIGFSGSMKWTHRYNDTIYFSIRGEVKLDDIMHPDFLFKVTPINENREDIEFTVLRNEINDTDNVIPNVSYGNTGYELIGSTITHVINSEYVKLLNRTTNTMTIKHINDSLLPSRSSIILANTRDGNLICRNKGELDLVVDLNPEKRKYHYSIELLTGTNEMNTQEYKEEYLIVDNRQFIEICRNHGDNYTDYHFNYHDYPDISAVKVINDGLIIVGRTHSMKYRSNNRIDYKLIADFIDEDKTRFKLVFKSQKALTNVKLKVDALDYFQQYRDKSITTEVIPVIEPSKLYTVEFEL